MTTAEIAIVVSMFSVLVSLFAVGWNVYHDVVLKPSVKVFFSVRKIAATDSNNPSYFMVKQGILDDGSQVPVYICISATNHGPRPVYLNSIMLKETSLQKRILKREKHAFLPPDNDNPYVSKKLPCRLEVGETLDLLVDCDAECFLKEQFTHLGIRDSFGITHWALEDDMKKAKKDWESKFNDQQNV